LVEVLARHCLARDRLQQDEDEPRRRDGAKASREEQPRSRASKFKLRVQTWRHRAFAVESCASADAGKFSTARRKTIDAHFHHAYIEHLKGGDNAMAKKKTAKKTTKKTTKKGKR
jgi:hypothetical protein